MTGQQMCEHIVKADILKLRNGKSPTWEQLWNYSPSGELSMISVWYERASAELGVWADGTPYKSIKEILPNGDIVREP